MRPFIVKIQATKFPKMEATQQVNQFLFLPFFTILFNFTILINYPFNIFISSIQSYLLYLKVYFRTNSFPSIINHQFLKFSIYQFIFFFYPIRKTLMQRNLQANYHLDQVESAHKDTVIASLKKELFELKDLEHDFLRLNDEVANIESKYTLLLDEKERAENEHKIKIDINKKNISEMRSEVDNLKMQIHKVTVQIDDTVRENSTLKRMCENRETEIASMMASNRQIEKNNELQQEQNKSLSITLKQLKQERTKNQNECERLNKLLDDSINTLKQLEKQTRQLQSSNTKLDNVLLQAEKDHTSLIQQMKAREQTIAQTNKKLEQLNQQNQELKEQTSKIEKQCDKAQAEYQEICANLEATVAKNKELSLKLKSMQNTLRMTESELDQSVIKRENLRKDHLQLANENKVLNAEIDKCLMSILEYEKINKDLQQEVENYIACDEEARAMLNRKEAMRSLLDQVTSKLQKTEQQIAHLR